MVRRLSADTDALFTVRPDDFVRSRDALAGQLRKAGRAADAAEVTSLRRPAPAVWVINQIARQHGDGARRFLDAVGQLRQAQLQASGATARAVEEHRSALQNLLNRANSLSTAAGLRWSGELARRVARTLVGAAADDDVREDLRHGRLVAEHPAPGFEALAGTPPRLRLLRGRAPRKRERAQTRDSQANHSRARHGRDELRRAKEAAVLGEQKWREWNRRARELDRAAGAHSRAAEEAERAARELAGQLRSLEKRVTSFEKRVTEERQAAKDAVRESERARQEAARAKAGVDSARRTLRAVRPLVAASASKA
jgi:hypothetical protein